jgi:uncharacterized membrane protein
VGGGMNRFWAACPDGIVLWVVVLVAILALYVGLYVWYHRITKKIRSKTLQKEPVASEWLSKFRELHSQGELSDEEFRTIKTTLAAQLQDELSSNGGKG